MAYIGREPLGGEVIIMDSIESQFNGVLTTFNLTRTVSGVTTAFYPVGSQQLLVSLGGVIQRPDPTGNTGFRISFNTIIFAVAPSASTSCFIISYGNLIDIGAPANNTVTTDKLVDGSVTPAKLSAGGPSWNTSGTLGIVNPNYYSGSYPWYINQNSTNGYLAINYYGNTNNFVIRDNGNVGIATASPGTKLHVNGPVKIGEGVATNTSKLLVNTLAGTAAGIQLFQDATESWIIQNPASSADLTFGASGTERLRITSAGLVGIGVSAPSYQLDLGGGTTVNTRIQIARGSDDSNAMRIGYNTIDLYRNVSLSSAQTGLAINQVGSDGTRNVFQIDSSGRCGIGTASPAEKLHISAASPYIRVEATGGVTGSAYYGFNNATGGADIVSTSHIRFAVPGLEAARIDSSGRLLVGTSSARSWAGITSQTQVEGAATFVSQSIVANSADTVGGLLALGKSRGTALGSHTVVQSGDILGRIYFVGADGSALIQGATITAEVDGTPGANDMPGRLVFSVTADGAASPTERMRISNTGRTVLLESSGGGFEVASTLAAGTDNLFTGYYGATNTITKGTASYAVRTNGNVLNTNNSYGALSDIKLKENIVNANSQWDDLKALQVRKYNFKEETGQQTHTQIGLVAQEVELVSPGLVSESPDRDAEGNDLGTVTKSVNYSVLYMKAVKALQEAMERIETLEAAVTALQQS